MDKIKVIILEDDLYNLKAVTKIIENQFPEIKIVNTASRVNEGIKKIEQHKPNLLIMDIHLLDGTSFDILRQCNYHDYKIVFMSAYHEYAIKAMQFASVEFIFKPFDINEFVVAIDRTINQLIDPNYQIKIKTLFNNIDEQQNKVILQGVNDIKVCDVNDIIWGKSIYGGANFYFSNGSYFFAAKPLRRFEAIFSDYSFFRCHPYYLINLEHIKEINPQLKRVKMINNDEIIYEERRYPQLKRLINSNKILETSMYI